MYCDKNFFMKGGEITVKEIKITKTIKGADDFALVNKRLHSSAVMLAFLSCTPIWGAVPPKN